MTCARQHNYKYLSSRLMEQLKKDKVAHIVKATMPMRETLFETLVLRINEPYWLLHAGCCEHFVVIDQIRYGMYRFLQFLHIY